MRAALGVLSLFAALTIADHLLTGGLYTARCVELAVSAVLGVLEQ
jgi:hypothetical protein